MHIERQSGAAGSGWVVETGSIAAVFVAVAMLTSTIVFSEPAIADMLMLGVIVAVPALGVARFGPTTMLHTAAWLVFVGLGIAGTFISATFDTAIKHQLVTLYLLIGAFATAGYIAGDPEPRFRLIMTCYTVACLIATLAAFVGYFHIVPSTYEVFTNYGRARGTFKDPNVYSAALVPALTYCAWVMLREATGRASIAALAALPIAVGLLISFSRGAWISAALSLAIVVWILFVRSRRSSDFRRMGWVASIGAAGLLLAIVAALQVDQVRSLLQERANMDQSYDQGPEGRFGGQQKARRLILENPFGIGTHTFRDVYHHEEPHNVYLSMFLNAGWIGGLLYLGSVLVTVWTGLRLAMRNGALQGPLVVASASFASVAFEGGIIDSDHWRHFFLMMACVWGLADAATQVRDPARRKEDQAPA